jgi:hypothetical protein
MYLTIFHLTLSIWGGGSGTEDVRSWSTEPKMFLLESSPVGTCKFGVCFSPSSTAHLLANESAIFVQAAVPCWVPYFVKLTRNSLRISDTGSLSGVITVSACKKETDQWIHSLANHGNYVPDLPPLVRQSVPENWWLRERLKLLTLIKAQLIPYFTEIKVHQIIPKQIYTKIGMQLFEISFCLISKILKFLPL